jgi:hypothetical protein
VVDDEVFERDFKEWLDQYPDLPMSRQELEDYMNERDERTKAAEREGR